MKIALICSHGGHLTELRMISRAFDDHETFYITYDNFRTRELDSRKYLLKNIGTNPLRMAKAFFVMARIFIRERPTAIVSTGSEIAIPAFILGKMFGTESIYIESWCRVSTPSGTGKIVYHLADLFLVQWEALLAAYGDKARHEGAVL